MEGIWLISYILLWLVVVGTVLTVLALVRQVGILHLQLQQHPHHTDSRADGLPIGTQAPDFVARTSNGEDVWLHSFRGRTTLLIFSSPGCDSCKHVLSEVSNRLDIQAKKLAILMISPGPLKSEQHRINGTIVLVLLDQQGEISRNYLVPSTPYGVLLDAEGIIQAKAALTTVEDVIRLIEQETTEEVLAPTVVQNQC